MLHIIASYRYKGKVVALRVYSDVDKKFKDVGMKIIQKMIMNNEMTLTDTDLTHIAMLSIETGDMHLDKENKYIYSDGYVREIMKTVRDNIEEECSKSIVRQRNKALVCIDGESTKIGKRTISVVKAVSYSGKEVITLAESDNVTAVASVDDRERIVQMGFDPYYYIGEAIDCREVSGEIELSNPISKIIQKENVLGTKTLEAVQLMEEVLLIRYNDENIEEFMVPDGITMVDGGAFYKCKRLKSIDYNDKVKYLSHTAFEGTPLKSYILKPCIETFAYNRYSGKEAEIIVEPNVANNITIM